jgi:hypothetical protein
MTQKINKTTKVNFIKFKLTDICDIIINPRNIKRKYSSIIISEDYFINYIPNNSINDTIRQNHYLLKNKSARHQKIKDEHFKYIYYYLESHKLQLSSILLEDIVSYIISIPSEEYMKMIINTLDTIYEQIQNNNNSIITYNKIKENIIISLTSNKCKLKKLGDICEIIHNDINQNDYIYYKSKIKRIIDKYLYYYIYYNADKSENAMIRIPLKKTQKEIIKECEYWDEMINKLNEQNNKLINYYFN